MTITKKVESVGEDMERLEALGIADGLYHEAPTVENSLVAPQKVKHDSYRVQQFRSSVHTKRTEGRFKQILVHACS